MRRSSGRVLLARPWRLDDAVFTGANRAYIEQSTGDSDPESASGACFFVTRILGVHPA